MEPNPIPIYPGLPFGPHTPDETNLAGFVDTGVNAEHPQLKGLILYQRDFTGEGDGDDHDHGTLVVLSYYAHFPGLVERTRDENDDADYRFRFHPPGTAMAKVVGTMPTDPQTMEQRMLEAMLWLSSLGVGVIGNTL